MRQNNSIELSFILIFLLGIMTIGNTQDGGSAGSFLRIGAGVRSFGFGGAYTAISNDASATYWNPAGLTQIESTQLLISNSKMSLDRNYTFAAIVSSFGLGKIAFSHINYSVGNIEQRNENGDLIGDFSISRTAYFLSYGLKIFESLSFGINGKLIRSKILDYQASGFGFDTGVLIKPIKQLAIGFVVQNINTEINWNINSSTREKIPVIFRTGIAIQPPQIPLIFSFDYEKGEKTKGQFHIGSELNFEGLSIRTGLDDGDLAFSAGIPLDLSFANLQFDYGYCNDPVFETSVHKFSVLLNFTKKDRSYTQSSNKTKIDDVLRTLYKTKVAGTKNDLIAIEIKPKYNFRKGMEFKIFGRSEDEKFHFLGKYIIIRLGNKYAAIQMISPGYEMTLKKGDVIFLKLD